MPAGIASQHDALDHHWSLLQLKDPRGECNASTDGAMGNLLVGPLVCRKDSDSRVGKLLLRAHKPINLCSGYKTQVFQGLLVNLMGHLHQWSLSWSLSGSFTSDNSFATSQILYLVLIEGENKKVAQKVVSRYTFAPILLSTTLNNAQQRSEALLLSTTLATAPEISEPLSLATFSKRKRCRCYM